MERGCQFRFGALKLEHEQLPEKLVVAVPLAAIVERHQEKVRAVGLGQQMRRVANLRHRLA